MTCFPGRNKNTWSHFFVSHSLRATGWCKAALSRPRWNPSGELGLQHFWPEELYPGCSFTFCVRAHSSRGHGLPQYRGAPAGAPQWPAGPVPSPRWGLWFWIMWFYKLYNVQQSVFTLLCSQQTTQCNQRFSSATGMNVHKFKNICWNVKITWITWHFEMFVDVSGICSAVGKVNVPYLKVEPLLENGFQIVFCLLHPFFNTSVCICSLSLAPCCHDISVNIVLGFVTCMAGRGCRETLHCWRAQGALWPEDYGEVSVSEVSNKQDEIYVFFLG